MEVKTSCKDCCFATIDGGDFQIGCKLGKLEKFTKLGTPIEVVDNHFEIKGRFCNTKRSEGWAKKGIDINSEIEISYDLIVVISESYNIDHLDESLSSINIDKINTIYVVNNSGVKFNALRNHLQTKFGSAKKWFVTQVLETPKPDYYKCIDLVANRVSSGFYLAIEAGEKLPKDVFNYFNSEINNELRQLGILYPTEGLWYIASTRIHKALGGNENGIHEEGGQEYYFSNLPSKIQFWSQKTNNELLVEEYDANNDLYTGIQS